MHSMMEQNVARFAVAASVGAFLLAGPALAQVDPVNVLAPYEEAQGFELMFDGATAASFRDRFVNYQQGVSTNTGTLHAGWNRKDTTDPELPGITFGAIVNTGVSGNANVDMRSRRTYRDFDWRFEFRNSGNQGVFYRFNTSGQYAWNTGIEYGIDNNVTQTTLKFRAGAAYDLFAPSEQAYHVSSSARWNSVRIVAKADSVEHWMNGVRVVSFKYWSPAFLAAYQDSKWTAYNRYCQTAPDNRTYIPEGYLGLQGDHGGAWQIRRMRILHDSTAGMDRVKTGPVDTSTVSIRSTRAERASDLRLNAAAGRLNVRFGTEELRSIELRSIDGALARRTAPAAGSREHSMDVSGLRSGVYVVRVESPTGIHHARALIP